MQIFNIMGLFHVNTEQKAVLSGVLFGELVSSDQEKGVERG